MSSVRTSSPDKWQRMSLVVMPTATSLMVKKDGLLKQCSRRSAPSFSVKERGGK